ncbi:putative metallocarboxypeptidase ECM14 [Delitschia confertaspora ATCC 74209]|uniref:Inactive metallocarboxypeptidase ECM14 n=1 Tax=Delitschia confertaspora ATCC 74209 TaxID=1513339 RepID=A0A9P4JQ32_9PLEO|nr:putative metallocarboxypeptidase ECM14 [Delitschia confertaspora ATCC 74209]
MRQSTFAVLSLLLFCPSLIAAAPPTAQCGHAPNAQCPERASHSWRKLSDAIISRVWGLPEKQKVLGNNKALKLANGAPTQNLLARYGEDVVLRFNISSAEEATALAEAIDVLFLDVWEFNENWVDIRIAKEVVPSLLGLLPSSLHKAHVPLMQNLDLAQAIFDSYPSPSSTDSRDGLSFSPNLQASQSENLFFQDYQPLSVITPWMSLLASMFTTHVRRINVGISYEGRDIPALRVGVHPTNNNQPPKPRKTILVTGGSHAREWISTSTVNFIAWSLITSYGKVHTVTHLLEEFDFVFVPTLNPDGYVYSWETDRLWRKNRQPTSLRFCRGIDLDRSFAFQWDDESTRSNPCSEFYPGVGPFDGVESKRFADWAKNETENNNVEFVSFLDLHSYSQQILYPFSYSCAKEPPSIEDLQELAFGLSKAIGSRKGHHYQVTSACEGNFFMPQNSDSNSKSTKDHTVLPRIESSGGSALDWFYHELKVRYAYQVKLRDTGSYGFLLPKENIVPTGKEVLDAVLYLGRFLMGEVGFAVEGVGEEVAKEQITKEREERERAEKEHGEKLRAGNEQVDEEEEEDSVFELRRRRRR